MNLPSSQVSCLRAYTSFQVDTRFIDGASVILYHAVVMLIIQRSFSLCVEIFGGLERQHALAIPIFLPGVTTLLVRI